MGRARYWESFFDLPTVVWGFVWGGVWAITIATLTRGWKRLSPGNQYTLVGLPFTLAICSPPMVIPLIAGEYFGKAGLVVALGISMPLTLLIFMHTQDDGSFLGRWRYKHLDIGILYKNRRQRICKQCGDYDTWGRWVDKPASDMLQSAYAPCRRCGASDFSYFYLDGRPAKQAGSLGFN